MNQIRAQTFDEVYKQMTLGEQLQGPGSGLGSGLKYGGLYGQIEESIYLNSSVDQTGKKTLSLGERSRSARKGPRNEGRAAV